MGMYTQVRGWFHIASYGGPLEEQEAQRVNAENRLIIVKDKFENDPAVVRKHLAWSTHFHPGSNGTLWLFTGLEFKNYDDDIDHWVKHLREVFPEIEGRLDLQYELEGIGCDVETWKINAHGIFKETEEAWCYGYAFHYPRDLYKRGAKGQYTAN